MKKSFLYTLLVVFLFACNQSQPDFVGSWRLDNIKVSGDIVAANDINNPTYTFGEDQIYEINVNGVVERGSWKLKGEYLILQNFKSHDVENKLKIVQSTPGHLEFSTGEGENTSIVTLLK